MLHQIGSGALGPVFRTYDPQLDRLIAVKAFRLDLIPEAVARLAEALRRLQGAVSHPAVVTPIDAGLEGMSPYLALEYVSAESLDVALRHLAPSPLDRALPILSDIAAAVTAAWAAGLGHGALHPRDVFVATGPTGTDVRVSGFGVVSAIESVGLKTPPRRPYSAPERERDGGTWDIRADVYSLGAIAHELLTKRRPAGPKEQDGSLVTGTTPEQRVLIRRVLAAALADRPDHRFASPVAFIEALEAIVRGEPLGPLPQGAETAEDATPDASPVSRVAVAPAMAVAPLLVGLDDEEPGQGQRDEPVAPAASVAVSDARENDIGSRLPVPSTENDSRYLPTARAPIVPAAAPLWTPPEPAPFPWTALVVTAVAGLMVGGAGGYVAGREMAPAPPPPSAAVAPITGTDVPVGPVSPTPPTTTTNAVLPTPPPPPVAEPLPSAPVPARSDSTPAGDHAKPATTPHAGETTSLGSAQIDTRPLGARVVIDGHASGVTPLTVPALHPGTHTVRIELKGYKTVTTTVVIKAGARERVAVTLEPVGWQNP